MKLLQKGFPENFSDLKRGEIMVKKMMRNVEQGEELFVPYGFFKDLQLRLVCEELES